MDDTRAWLIDADGFYQHFGVQPMQFADYLSLVGDSVDDIPGVPGVGPKTAAALLGAYPELELIQQNLECIVDLPLRGAAKVQQRISDHWEQVLLAKRLTALEEHIPDLDHPPVFTPQTKCVEAFNTRLAELGLSGPLVQRGRRLQAEWESA